MNTLQLLFVTLLALLTLAALVTVVIVLLVRRPSSGRDAARSAGPRSGAAAPGMAPIAPSRLVVTGTSATAYGERASGKEARNDPRTQLWRDAAILLLAVLSIALIGLNVLPAFAPQGQVATATGTPNLASPFVGGGPSASAGPSAKASSPAGRTPGSSPSPSLAPGATQAPAAGSSQRPASTPRPTPRPTATPKPTHKPTPPPNPTPTPTPPPASPLPSVPASPIPTPTP